MKLWRFALVPMAALPFLALACGDDTTVLQPDGQASGVSVSGVGSAFGEPDIAVLTLGVEAQEESVGGAREAAAASMNAMLDALMEGGVAEEDIQTSRFSVQPRYDFSNDRQEIIGFFVSNIVTAKIRNIDDTGALIDAAAEAGGDLSRIDNLVFTIDDPSALEEQARVDAMAEARSKAETLADAGGVDLGNPISISEGGGVQPIPFALADAAAASQELARTPIQTGELEVAVTVSVIYALD